MINKMYLSRLAIIITTSCNLRCKLCAVGVPTQKKTLHLNVDEFKKSIKAGFDLIDFVDSLEFGGGEVFLHIGLPAMIEAAMEWENRFKHFLIVTNGTILPNDILLDTLRKYKDRAIIHVSDYGISPHHTNTLSGIFEEIGIQYRIDKYWGDNQYQNGWVDPGDVAPHDRNKEELHRIFSNCGLVKNGGCWRIYRGVLHFCARSCRCADEGFVFEDDVVNIFDMSSSIKQKQAKLYSIMDASYLTACDYCNGDLGTTDKSKRVPAAEQVNI